LTAAAGVAVDGAGTVYATDSATNTLYRTKAGGVAAAFAATAQLSKPQQVAVDTAGNVYVADSGNNRIAVVTPQGTASTLALQLTSLAQAVLSAPQGVAVDRNGNVYIADTGNARVLVQPANVEYATQVVATGGVTLSKPTALALDQAGNLYVVDAGLDEVIELPQAQQGLNYVEATPAGATPVLYKSSALTSPQGVVVDPAGSVYVSDSVANTVFVFSAGSSTPVVLIPTGLSAPASSVSAPAGLALDTASNLYIADAGNSRVYEEYRGSQTLAMGAVGIGTTSPLYPVQVGSYGTSATTLTNFAISTAFTSVNTGSAQCGPTTQLGIGGHCSAAVDFTPSATPGAVSGSLEATDNALSSPQTITLTATGVVQQAQTITWTLASPVTYGVAPITLGATASSGLTVTYTITSGASLGSIKGNVLTVTGAGTIVIQASQAGAPAYKAATSVSQTLVVNKAAASFTATSVVGGTGVIPPLTFTTTGLVNGDTLATAFTGALSETTTATTSSVAGTYPITLTQGSLAAANYTLSFVGGTLTLQGTGQTINFTALPAMVTYGVAPLSVAATASSGLPVGFAVTGPATLSGSTLTITGAGTVTVTATQSGSTPVYQPYAPAQAVVQTIVVQAATLTVTANSVSRIYGVANPAFTGSIVGAQNGDVFTETYATTATSSSNAGPYAITPDVTGANPANYTIVKVAGTLTITQATTTVTLSATPNPAPVNGLITLTATLTIPGGTPSGTFTFYANGLSLGSTTSYTTNGTTVTAVKANTANNASETYTVSYGNDANLGNATSAAVVVPVLSATTTKLSSSNMVPGTNQAFTLQATVLSSLVGATPATGTVTFTNVNGGVTTTLGVASVSAAGLANLTLTITTPGALALTATYSGDSLHAASAGTIIESYSTTTALNVLPVVVGVPTFQISLAALTSLVYQIPPIGSAAAPAPAAPVLCGAIPTGTSTGNYKYYASPYCVVNSNSVTATAGSVVQQVVSIQSFFGLASTVTMSCSGLPQNGSCLFSPPSTPLTPTASGQQVVVSIDTVQVIKGENRGPGQPFGHSQEVAWAGMLLCSLGLLGAGRRLRRRMAGRLLTMIAVLALGSASTVGLSGCANLNGSATAVAGVYPVVITATDGTVVQMVTVNLTLQ
jgi:sugar lactone lactonase YvrE